MKQEKILISILLVALCLGAWYQTFAGTASKNQKQYKQSITAASEYMDRGLYQKAAEEYKKALAVKDSEKVWSELLSAYANRYKEDDHVYDEYLDAAKQAVAAHGKNAKFVITLANLYSDNEDYEKAYKCIKKAIDDGAKSDKLTAALEELRYGYEVNWKSYSAYSTNTFGYYAVDDNDGWKYFDLEGKEEKGGPYTYAGKAGKNGVRLVAYKDRTEVIDAGGTVQGKLGFIPVDSRMPSEGYCVVNDGKNFSVYNLLGDKQFGEFEDASTVLNGTLAVKTNGKWSIIDLNQKSINKNKYTDIKLSVGDTYSLNGIMIAKEDQSYALYDSDFKKIGKFSAEDIDCYTGDGYIAFCQKGKWGFVDTDGNVVIKPTYDNAKSFSNGLAAVCIDKKWGFINKNGEMVISPAFADAGYFNDKGKCMVSPGAREWQLLSLNIWEE